MISRRLFLTCTPALALRARVPCGLAIWDLEKDCGLPESVRGFQAALKRVRVVQRFPGGAGILIVPGVLTLRPSAIHQLQTFAARGGTVVLETALAFGSPSNFAEQQRVLSREFGIDIDRPVDLWRRPGRVGLPYIEYHRPVSVWVRDFGRAVPVLASARHPLATVQHQTVAARYPFGHGEINFLGSPLGPVLLSGDREGSQWLEAFARGGHDKF
jgi:hypothetical protein